MSDITVRQIQLDDAEAFNAHRRCIADEPNNSITYSAGEYLRTVEEERKMIQAAITEDGQQLVIALAEGQIVGGCTCRGPSHPALRHTVGLGIDIIPEYRGCGVGNALMTAMMEWAESNPLVRRVELTVFTSNHRAIGLYLKHGFTIEGTRHAAYFKYGEYIDAYEMARLFGFRQGNESLA